MPVWAWGLIAIVLNAVIGVSVIAKKRAAIVSKEATEALRALADITEEFANDFEDGKLDQVEAERLGSKASIFWKEAKDIVKAALGQI